MRKYVERYKFFAIETQYRKIRNSAKKFVSPASAGCQMNEEAVSFDAEASWIFAGGESLWKTSLAFVRTSSPHKKTEGGTPS
jgi:hypothetical protein